MMLNTDTVGPNNLSSDGSRMWMYASIAMMIMTLQPVQADI
jgi:hypothetical protein